MGVPEQPSPLGLAQSLWPPFPARARPGLAHLLPLSSPALLPGRPPNSDPLPRPRKPLRRQPPFAISPFTRKSEFFRGPSGPPLPSGAVRTAEGYFAVSLHHSRRASQMKAVVLQASLRHMFLSIIIAIYNWSHWPGLIGRL